MKRYDEAFKSIERPFAWVDLDGIDSNISTLALLAQEKKIRIATKSIRSLEMLRYLEEKVPYFNGWMTFTAAETSYLAKAGFDHFLLGYPTVEVAAIEELCRWVEKGKSITFMIDDLQQAGLLNKIAMKNNVILSICLDLNLSLPTPILYFGTRRSSLITLNDCIQLIEKLKAMDNLIITGVMGYEAQIAGVGDRPSNTSKGWFIQHLQNLSKNKIKKFRKRIVHEVNKQIDTLQFVNGGGTGSIEFTASCEEVTEITVGSGYFKPALFDYYKNSKLKPAAGFALSVTRKPMRNTIVCHGGGYVASGTIDEERLPKIMTPGLSYYSTEGAGEVQTPLKITSSAKYDIGDTIYFRHAKAGELCERFNELHVVRNGMYKGTFKTYRGDGQCFL